MRHLMLRSLIIATLSLTPFGALAQNGTSRSQIKKIKAEAIQTTTLVTFSNYEYSEPGLMKISGMLPGVLAGVEYREKPTEFFLKGGLEFYSGKITYDGSLMSGKPISHKSKTSYFALQPMAGYTTPLQANLFLDYSGGLGYRYLNEKGESVYAYEREQTYLYFPVQAQIRNRISSTAQFNAGVELDFLIKGSNTSHLSDVSSAAPDLKFEQRNGSGTRLFAGLTSKVNDVAVHGEIYHRTWSIRESTKASVITNEGIYTFVEPRNNTSQTGISAGLVF